MRSLHALFGLILAAGPILSSPPALAWGALGHELQAEAAVELMSSPLKKFFKPNTDDLKRIINVPDRSWKSGAGAYYERPAHFFQWDLYQQCQIGKDLPLPMQQALDALGASFLNKNGTGLWRIDQIHRLLVTALREQKWTHVIQMASILGHYVGDLSQPMHVSSDYDGQSIGRRGVHQHFETNLLERQDRAALLAAVLKKAGELRPSAFRKGASSPLDVSLEESATALGNLPSILRIFEEDDGGSEDEKLLPLAIDSLARGTVTLAAMWDTAYAAANPASIAEQTVAVREPKWVPFRVKKGEPAPALRGTIDSESFLH